MVGTIDQCLQTIRQAINWCARHRGTRGAGDTRADRVHPTTGDTGDRSSAPLVLHRDCSEVLPDDGGSAFSMDLL